MIQSLARLFVRLPLSQEQKGAVKHLLQANGLCICGRWLSPTDAKFMFADVGPPDHPDMARKDFVVIGAFCYSCASQVNNVLKQLKDQAYKEKRSEGELRG